MTAKSKTPFFMTITTLTGLKEQKRMGWVKRGVKNVESVADHSWRAGLMAYLLAPKGYDKEKMLKMGLIHDTTEIFDNDYTPTDGITKEEKEKRERIAVEKFFKTIPKKEQKEFREIWNEFEHHTTKEGVFVKQIETLEMLFQALEYEKEGNFKKDLYEFITYARKNRKTKWHPALKPYFDEIQKRWPKKSKKNFHDDKKYYY
jgi:putative hydrolase of HD superfamily